MIEHRRGIIPRRRWIGLAGLGLASAGLVGRRVAFGQAKPAATDPLSDAKARASRLGLGRFEEVEKGHFRAAGDAPAAFIGEALGLAESFAADFVRHFRDRKFTLEWPAARLPFIILGGVESYARFEGIDSKDAEGGNYNLDTNALVTYDFRKAGARSTEAAVDNTLTLVHETAHQLCFNLGPFDRASIPPKVVSEGLATYAETWGPRRRGEVGAVNRRRLLGLEQARAGGSAWVPLARLFETDAPYENPDTVQIAYAEGWMMTHHLLTDPKRRAGYQAYLAAIKAAKPVEGKGQGSGRVELARAHLGDLDALDRAVRKAY